MRGCDRPSWLGFAEGRFPACRCERLLVRVLLLLVVLVGFVFGGITNARADFWSDLLEGQCGEGEEYRGYHRDATRCPRCLGQWTRGTGQFAACIYCTAGCAGSTSGGTYVVCQGRDGYPQPVCLADALSDDEEEDAEREGDILDLLAGGGGLGSLFGAPGGVNPAVGLFGDDIGAVQDDDVVPQVGSDADGYSCPDGTRVIEEGENAGMCRVTDRCIFYGAASGTYPDCVCASDASVYPDRLAGIGWTWDQYSLRCVPGQAANPGSALAPDLWDTTGNDSTLFNLVCGSDWTARTRGGYSIEDYLQTSSPVFVARRGGIEVARYGSAASLTIQLGRSDWSLSSGEEDDEEDFGNIICSWIRGPLAEVENAISGFSLGRLNTGCPTIDVPVFSSVAQVDLHCFIVGRWLGLIQAAFIVGYSFLGVRWFLRYG